MNLGTPPKANARQYIFKLIGKDGFVVGTYNNVENSFCIAELQVVGFADKSFGDATFENRFIEDADIEAWEYL